MDRVHREQGSFALYYFHLGKMAGVLAVDRPDEEHKPMRSRVRMRVLYEDVAATLRDDRIDLNRLIG